MVEQPLEDLLGRLERERREADRLYNDALTAVNQAIQPVPVLPAAPPPHDASSAARLNQHWDILPAGAPDAGTGLKGRLRAAIWSLVGPPLESQRQFNAALVEHLNRNAESAAALPRATADVVVTLKEALAGLYRFQSLLVQYLMTITAFVDTRDRQLGAAGVAEQLRFVEQRLFALSREVDRLTAAAPSTASAGAPPSAATVGDARHGDARHNDTNEEAFVAPVASMTYVGFEDRFRGSESEIRGRVEDYLPIFAGASNVVDIGCGRGELLDALRDRGIVARGVDVNHAMVELCRARGLAVDESDAVSFLSRQAAGSVGGLVAIQVVEHFTPAYLSAFLSAAYQALSPSAPLVLETINPACWSAFFETYIRDLTHQRPLHPETLKYLVQASGFTQVDIQFRQPVRDVDRLARVTRADGEAASADLSPAVREAIAALNDHADKLNVRLFSSFDYVVIARR